MSRIKEFYHEEICESMEKAGLLVPEDKTEEIEDKTEEDEDK